MEYAGDTILGISVRIFPEKLHWGKKLHLNVRSASMDWGVELREKGKWEARWAPAFIFLRFVTVGIMRPGACYHT